MRKYNENPKNFPGLSPGPAGRLTVPPKPLADYSNLCAVVFSK